MGEMSTWIVRTCAGGSLSGPRIAVKDNIDLAGVPTTAASRALAAIAAPASADAACLAGVRAAGAPIVGKTNLNELASGGTGVNPHFGTPVNPFDPALIPGGSSSGNAVALAAGEADIAIGTDTAGSIRTPAACCGIVGLKTTWGRIRLDGVWPLAPSLDTVGPMAADVAGVITGMRLLTAGFELAPAPAPVIGRVRLPNVDPAIDVAVDAALAASGVGLLDVVLPGWDAAEQAAIAVMLAEAWRSDRELYAAHADLIAADVRERLEQGREIPIERYRGGLAHRVAWRAELASAFARAPVLAWPTLAFFPPRLDAPVPNTRRTNIAVNLAGHPALALPVPAGPLPAGMQLMGPDGSEGLLCATGILLQAAAASLH
jgi:amidase